mmetsp:Transcript_3626/g.9382  ORF Transcript_3626/g.9382 Transcript_3626/m.9382 type:complete len:425 (+) Transcript_3626:236-1510(+)
METPFTNEVNSIAFEKMLRRIDKHTAVQLGHFLGRPVFNFDLHPETRKTDAEGGKLKTGRMNITIYDLDAKNKQKKIEDQLIKEAQAAEAAARAVGSRITVIGGALGRGTQGAMRGSGQKLSTMIRSRVSCKPAVAFNSSAQSGLADGSPPGSPVPLDSPRTPVPGQVHTNSSDSALPAVCALQDGMRNPLKSFTLTTHPELAPLEAQAALVGDISSADPAPATEAACHMRCAVSVDVNGADDLLLPSEAAACAEVALAERVRRSSHLSAVSGDCPSRKASLVNDEAAKAMYGIEEEEIHPSQLGVALCLRSAMSRQRDHNRMLNLVHCAQARRGGCKRASCPTLSAQPSSPCTRHRWPATAAAASAAETAAAAAETMAEHGACADICDDADNDDIAQINRMSGDVPPRALTKKISSWRLRATG